MTEATVRRSRAAKSQPPAPPPTFEDPLQELLAAMSAVRDGDFDVRVPRHWDGIAGRLADAFNEIVAQNRK